MIYRTPHQTNFSVRSNALLQDNTLSNEAYRLINHLLSLPPDWTIYPKQLMKYFSWSKDRVYKALKELRERGYASLKRCRRSSIWTIYESPLMGQSDATPCAEIVDESNGNGASKIPLSKNSCATDTLQNNKISLTKKEKTTTPEPLPEAHVNDEPSVVVASKLIEQPVTTPTTLPEVIVEQIERLPVTPKEKKIAAKTLSNLTLDECKMILAVYAAALVKGGIANKIGYLVVLVKRAKDGSLSPVTTNHQPTLSERLAKQEADRKAEAERGVMSNDEWARGMISKLGLEAFLKIAPWYTTPQ